MGWVRRGWETGGLGVALALVLPSMARAERVVYLNADPTVLNNASGQDPTLDSYSTTGFVPGAISGWPGLTDEQRAELTYFLREGTVPFDIVFVWDRPAVGSYDMVVMGTAADNSTLFPDLGCSAAVGLADCSDMNAENVSFLFHGCMPAAQQTDMHRVAFTTLTALGFGWGLENLATSGQIGGSYTGNGLQFGNACVAVSNGQCNDHVGCAVGQQNSTADLNARIGPRVDDGPPTVVITSPTTDTLVDASFEITADVVDEFGGLGVTLDIVEAAQEMADDEPPYAWSLSNVPAGVWTLRVIAVDADANETTAEVTVCVDVPDCGGAPSDDSGTGTAGDTGSPAVDSSGGEPSDTTSAPAGSSTGEADGTGAGIDPTIPANPTGFGGGEAETGCGCRSASGSGALAWGLVLVAWLRRRTLRRTQTRAKRLTQIRDE